MPDPIYLNLDPEIRQRIKAKADEAIASGIPAEQVVKWLDDNVEEVITQATPPPEPRSLADRFLGPMLEPSVENLVALPISFYTGPLAGRAAARMFPVAAGVKRLAATFLSDPRLRTIEFEVAERAGLAAAKDSLARLVEEPKLLQRVARSFGFSLPFGVTDAIRASTEDESPAAAMASTIGVFTALDMALVGLGAAGRAASRAFGSRVNAELLRQTGELDLLMGLGREGADEAAILAQLHPEVQERLQQMVERDIQEVYAGFMSSAQRRSVAPGQELVRRPEAPASTLEAQSPLRAATQADIEAIMAAPRPQVAIPEGPAAIEAQFEALQAGRKPAMLVMRGSKFPERAALGSSIRRIETSRGTLLVRRETDVADLLAAEEPVAIGETRLAEILGYPDVRPAPGKPTAVIVGRNEAGQEIMTIEVAPARVQEAVADVRAVVGPKGKVEVGGEAQRRAVIAERLKAGPFDAEQRVAAVVRARAGQASVFDEAVLASMSRPEVEAILRRHAAKSLLKPQGVIGIAQGVRAAMDDLTTKSPSQAALIEQGIDVAERAGLIAADDPVAQTLKSAIKRGKGAAPAPAVAKSQTAATAPKSPKRTKAQQLTEIIEDDLPPMKKAERTAAEEAVLRKVAAGDADVIAMRDLGYSADEISRTRPAARHRIATEKLRPEDVSILQSGDVHVVVSRGGRAEPITTPEPGQATATEDGLAVVTGRTPTGDPVVAKETPLGTAQTAAVTATPARPAPQRIDDTNARRGYLRSILDRFKKPNGQSYEELPRSVVDESALPAWVKLEPPALGQIVTSSTPVEMTVGRKKVTLAAGAEMFVAREAIRRTRGDGSSIVARTHVVAMLKINDVGDAVPVPVRMGSRDELTKAGLKITDKFIGGSVIEAQKRVDLYNARMRRFLEEQLEKAIPEFEKEIYRESLKDSVVGGLTKKILDAARRRSGVAEEIARGIRPPQIGGAIGGLGGPGAGSQTQALDALAFGSKKARELGVAEATIYTGLDPADFQREIQAFAKQNPEEYERLVQAMTDDAVETIALPETEILTVTAPVRQDVAGLMKMISEKGTVAEDDLGDLLIGLNDGARAKGLRMGDADVFDFASKQAKLKGTVQFYDEATGYKAYESDDLAAAVKWLDELDPTDADYRRRLEASTSAGEIDGRNRDGGC